MSFRSAFIAIVIGFGLVLGERRPAMNSPAQQPTFPAAPNADAKAPAAAGQT